MDKRFLGKLISWPHYPWLVWGLAAAVFLIEYFARIAPAVMVDQLMMDFHVQALALGSLSACFYYTYVGMQIPAGLLLDRLNIRWLLVCMALICAISCLLLASSTHLSEALLARALVGFGAAFAFIGTLKLVSLWFRPNQFGLLAGLTQSVGMLGAAMGQTSMAYLVTRIGWRHTLHSVAFSLMFIVLVLAIFLRTPVQKTRPVRKMSIWKACGHLMDGLMIVLKNPQSWLNALLAGLLYAPTVIIAELWGVKFLQQTYHLSTPYAASGIGLIFIGWTLGGPLTGWLSDHLGRRKLILGLSALLSLIFISIFLFVPNLPLSVLFAVLFLYGMANTGVATTYAIAAELNSPALSGTSVAFANMASVLIGAVFQPVIGWLIDKNSVLERGVLVYSAYGFRVAMIILPVCLLLAMFVTLTIREDFNQEHVSHEEFAATV